LPPAVFNAEPPGRRGNTGNFFSEEEFHSDPMRFAAFRCLQRRDAGERREISFKKISVRAVVARSIDRTSLVANFV
jgi:hypothetical protein